MRRSILALIAVVLLLSGCASAGRSKFSNAESFIADNNLVGKSVEEVVAEFGEPELRYVANGKDMMEYRYVSVHNNVWSYLFFIGLFFPADRYNMNYLYLTVGKDGKIEMQDAYHKTDRFPKKNVWF